ncbi:hypothetical protein BD413DRAFT_617317 [Trametes elegans]|nr:hypothetical protein BD413DRAFT_617317 [Trametes elegans]
MYTETIVAVSIKPSHVDSGDAENSSIGFSTCGDDCISAAAENSFCNPADNLKCLCQNFEAQNNAMSCLNRQCSFKDMDTFDEAMAHCLDPDPKGTAVVHRLYHGAYDVGTDIFCSTNRFARYATDHHHLSASSPHHVFSKFITEDDL